MSCEECKEQVFELIEREAADPEGVRAILAECPDCRAEFDALKAALALVDQLPAAEPPADIDVAILARAEQHIQSTGFEPASGAAEKQRVIPFRKRMLQTPPWAMAAIALLAVGIGVWSIPRTVQLESDAALPESKAKEAVHMAEAPAEVQAIEDQPGGMQKSEEAEIAAMDEIRDDAPVATMESARAGSRPARRQAPRAKKVRESGAKGSAAGADEENLARARAAAPAVAKDEGLAQPSAPARGIATAADAELAAVKVDDSDVKTGERSECEAKIRAFERRIRDDDRYEPGPEEALAIGRCYQTVGNTAKARRWLQRAAANPATKRRARKALQTLPSK